jgi:hypothetical protein
MQTDSDNPELPKKKKTPIKKSKEIKPVVSSEQIKKLLRDALIKNLDDSAKQTEIEIDALIATMEEFLRSFILIGYNLNSEPVVITNARSQIDADALNTALSRLFFSIHGQGGGPI